MLIYAPIGDVNRKYQESYSRFYGQVLSIDAAIYINSIILSEFYNANLRIDFNEWKKNSGHHTADYKRDYVGTQAYCDAVDSINAAVRQILQKAIPISDQFNSADHNRIASEMTHRDYNDNFILERAAKKKYKVVSNDRDLLDNSWEVTVISGLL